MRFLRMLSDSGVQSFTYSCCGATQEASPLPGRFRGHARGEFKPSAPENVEGTKCPVSVPRVSSFVRSAAKKSCILFVLDATILADGRRFG